jgi:hypothetical protein
MLLLSPARWWVLGIQAGLNLAFSLALFQGSMGFGVSLELSNKLKVKGAFLFYGILSLSGGILVLAAPYALAGLGQCLDSLRLKRMVH